MTQSSDQKRADILDAALTEFAKQGFAQASTNTIAATAGVAKGLVFHHFKSKEALFLAVAEDVMARLTPAFEKTLADAPPDLFARVLAWTERKFALMREDPRRLRFLLFVMNEAPPELRERGRARAEAQVLELMPRFLVGIDPKAFRTGVSPADALEAIWALSAGLEQQIRPLLGAGRLGLRGAEEVLALARRTLGVLRTGLSRAPSGRKVSSAPARNPRGDRSPR
jgi:AcrR family transcriptional regulator